MLLSDTILARSSDTDFVKVIFGVVVAIIWGIASLIAAVNKKAAENKRRQQYGQLPSDRGRAAMPPIPVPRQVFKPAPPPIQKKQKKKAPPQKAPPPQPVFQAASPENRPIDEGAKSPTARSTTAAAVAANPSRIARLTRQPQSLRAAFILATVLEPPKSAHSERGSRA